MGNVLPQGSKVVLVTVGTSKFDSLIKKIDEEDFQKELQKLGYTHVLYQVGNGKYIPKTTILHTKVEKYIEEFCSYVQHADLIISHLGAGTLLEVFKHRKQALFIPNPDVKDKHQHELLDVLDRIFVCDLCSLKLRIKCPPRGTGEFYDKLLPRKEFNNMLYTLVNYDPVKVVKRSQLI